MDPPDAGPGARFRAVAGQVQQLTFGGVAVLHPEPLEVDQGRLAQTIDRVLQRRERDQTLVVRLLSFESS
ncbi:MAG: hypothetical protein Kilf2KO_09750 [Rhodospirillales bacterium]